jgi:hypothetical protein
LSKNRKKKVRSVPILEYNNRDQITPYLGFRHITGVLQWEPYQKARYIAQLVETSKLSFAAIARSIGSKAPTVREHYIAYALVRQGRDAFLLDTQYAEAAFGVLRRALSDPDIRSYIGVSLDRSERELSRPVPKSRASHVAEFFDWAFGSDSTDPVIGESRDLRKLGTVLASAQSVEVLRSTRNLDYAFEMSGGEEQKLIENLRAASYNLDQALPHAIRHTSNKDVAAAVRRCFQTLMEIVRHFPDAARSA